LVPFGLKKAILSYLEQIQPIRTGIQFVTQLDDDEQLLPEKIRLTFFRVFQQAVMNSIRHSGADRVVIRFILDPAQITLEVRDNGKGFDVPERWLDLVREGHYGLAGAVERVESIGGKFKVESLPGMGTLIRITTPRPDEIVSCSVDPLPVPSRIGTELHPKRNRKFMDS
jgi:signal transduction histidine kinase